MVYTKNGDQQNDVEESRNQLVEAAILWPRARPSAGLIMLTLNQHWFNVLG